MEEITCFKCNDCDKLVEKGDETIINNDYTVCKECFDDGSYLCCDDCSEYTDDFTEVGNKVLCNGCLEKLPTCCNCSDPMAEDDTVHYIGGDSICNDCYENGDYGWCEDCEEECQYMTEVKYISRGRVRDRIVCDDCRDRNYSRCEQCSEHFGCDDLRDVGGVDVCIDCIETSGNYDTCYNCDEWTHSDNMSHNESEDRWYCDDCYGQSKRHIKNYSYKPDAKFFGKGELFFGLELEVENDKKSIDNNEMADLIKDDNLYFKSDGSLKTGFEIVSHPMTFEYIIKSQLEFKDKLDKLIGNGFRSYDSTTCGMHIHLSKKSFGTWQLYRFMKFFIDNKDFVVSISQRKTEALQNWAAIENENDNDLIYKAKKKAGNSRRYTAINLQNDATIELRIFRGTLNFNSFMKNIQFAHAMFCFTRDEKDMTVDNFKKYINNFNEYSLLKKFLKDKKI